MKDFCRKICLSMIKEAAAVPQKHGVYKLEYSSSFGRFRGSSKTLYIGKTGNFRDRIFKEYLKGSGGSTAKRIYKCIKRVSKKHVFVRWKICKNHKKTEKKELNKYEKKHQELPPWNRSK